MSRQFLRVDHALNQNSYYEATVTRPDFPVLQESLDADVVVVGAGFSGLSCALELAERGDKVVVLEAGRVCSGASGRNGGQAIVGFASEQVLLEKYLGKQDADRLWNMSLQAVGLMDQRIAQHGIDCDRVKGYLYVADSAHKARSLQGYAHALQDRGMAVELRTGAAVAQHIQSPRYVMSVREEISGHLHPLKYGLGLARAAQEAGVKIFEYSAVTHLERGGLCTARTAQGQVRAKRVVLAGNCHLAALSPGLAPELTPRIMPVGTYIIGTEPLGRDVQQALIPSNAAVCDNNFVLDYFRFSAEHCLLFGGRVSYTTVTPARLQESMRQRMVKIFPQLGHAKVKHVWGGFVDVTMNRAPDFGRLGEHRNIYYLQGFSGHGVAVTGLGGKLVAEAMHHETSGLEVFEKIPHHTFPGGSWLRAPLLALGMLYYRMMDRL